MHPYTLTHPSLSKSLSKALPKAALRKTAPLAPVAPAGVCGAGQRAATLERGAALAGVSGRRWAGPLTRRGRALVVPRADVNTDVISGVPTA
jgi:hypothetical protein